MNGNTITVVGNLTRDPELRFTTGGRASCSASIAAGYRYQQNGEWKEDTSFFNLEIWGELAENCAASLAKGVRVIVTGRMKQRSYEKDGEKKTVWDLVVDAIGPDLRWARADIERVDRSSNNGTAQPAPTQDRAPDPIYGDEEPF